MVANDDEKDKKPLGSPDTIRDNGDRSLLIPGEENKEIQDSLKQARPKRIPMKHLTAAEFQAKLESNPALKKGYESHLAAISQLKEATEKVKNTGYLGTLFGHGTDDMLAANDKMNAANAEFRRALDQGGFDEATKKQLISYQLNTTKDVHAAAAQAAGDFSDRAENYAAATKVVRNTAVGAGLTVGAVMTGGATLAASGALLTEGGLTVATGTGLMAGGAATGGMAAEGYSLLRDEGKVALEASINGDSKKSFASNIAAEQSLRDNQIMQNADAAGRKGMAIGAALPLAVTPAGQISFAGFASYTGAESTIDAGKNLKDAYSLNKQESEARKSGNTELANDLKKQRNEHIIDGTLAVGDTAAILGVGNRVTKKLVGTNNTEIPPSTTGENVRRNPNKPVEGVTLPEPGTGFKKIDAPSDIETHYLSKNYGRTRDASSSNTTDNTRQYRTEYDKANDKNLGRTQIDSSVTRDVQGNMLRRRVTTYGPGDHVNFPTQKSQASRKFDANGNLIGGENQTRLSDGSRRIVKTNSEGIQSTSISARGDIKQRQWKKSNVTDEALPHLTESMSSPAKPETVRVKSRSMDSEGNLVGHNTTYGPDGLVRRSVVQSKEGFQGMQMSPDGNKLNQISRDATGRTTKRKEWKFGTNGEATIYTKSPQTGRETVSTISGGDMIGGKAEKTIYDSGHRKVKETLSMETPTDEEVDSIHPLPSKKKVSTPSL